MGRCNAQAESVAVSDTYPKCFAPEKHRSVFAGKVHQAGIRRAVFVIIPSDRERCFSLLPGGVVVFLFCSRCFVTMALTKVASSWGEENELASFSVSRY